MKIGAIDLFCGVGGLTYGLEKAGIDVVAGIDIDDSCEFAFTKNNNALFINKSIDDVKGSEIKELLKGYDIKVLVGCAPCQPFSNHQKNKKDRSQHKDWKLLYQFARLIKETKPHIISMENVPDLIKEEVFKDFIQTLKDMNYFISYKVVNVGDYGVPQRRRRLILLASRKGTIELLKKTHNRNNYVTVKETIGNLPKIAAGVNCKKDRLHISPSLSPKNLERIQNSIQGGTWKDWPSHLVVNCHKKTGGQTYSSVYGRMSWNKVAPTITTQFTYYGTGRFGHPEQDRAITLREGALLQTFPINYDFIPKNKNIIITEVARHIGNAVPPRIGEIIGKSILSNLKISGEN